jgi:hypothetical protein
MSGTSINLGVLNYVLNNWNKQVDVIQNDFVYAKFFITKDNVGGVIDQINKYVSISISDEIIMSSDNYIEFFEISNNNSIIFNEPGIYEIIGKIIHIKPDFLYGSIYSYNLGFIYSINDISSNENFSTISHKNAIVSDIIKIENINDEIFFKVKLGKSENDINTFLDETNQYNIEDLFMTINGEITIVRKGNI